MRMLRRIQLSLQGAARSALSVFGAAGTRRRPDDSVPGVFGRGPFFGAGAAQDVGHRVVALMALVRHERLVVAACQRNGKRPRASPRRRIVYGDGPSDL